MARPFSESTVEEAALQWLGEMGYAVLPGPEIEHEMPRIRRGEEGERLIAEAEVM